MNTSWLYTIYMYKMDCWKKLICIYKLFPFACCRSWLIFQFDRTFLKKKYHIHVLNCGPRMRVEKYIWNMIVIHPDFFRKSMSTITSIVRYLLSFWRPKRLACNFSWNLEIFFFLSSNLPESNPEINWKMDRWILYFFITVYVLCTFADIVI